MADRLKGITIELGLDAGGLKSLNSVLKDVKTSISKTGLALKDVNKLMKINPSNFTLLGQKQAYLGDQISNTKEKLEKLKLAQSQMDEKIKAGAEVNQEQYRALQREIIETEGKLKNLQREFAKGGGASKIAQGFVAAGTAIQQAGEKIKDFGKQISGVGRELTPISAAFTAIGVGSLKLNKKWDTAFDNMIFKSGKTGESAQELRDMLKSMYAGSAFELTDISDTLGQVSARFKGLDNTQIEKISTSLLKFQKITGTDAKKSVDDLGKVMAAFKIPAGDYEKVLDGLVTAQTEAGADIENLIKVMKNYGAPLRSLFGNDIKMSIGFLGSLDKAGANSTKVMMALQKALTAELKEMTPEKAKKAMEDMFKTLKGGAMSVDEMKTALELMGSRGGLALVDAFSNAGLSWDELVTVIESGGTTVNGVFDETYNAEEKNRQKIHEMEVAAQDFAASVSEVVTPALGIVSDKVKDLKTGWDKLDGAQKRNILKFGGITAIAAPALILLGKVIESLGTVVGFLGKIFKGIGMIAGGGGLGAVTLALAALYAEAKLLTALFPHWDKFTNWLSERFKNDSSRQNFEKNEQKKREAMKMTDEEAAKYYQNEATRASGQQKLYLEQQAASHERAAAAKQDYIEQANAFGDMTYKINKWFGATDEAAKKASDGVKTKFKTLPPALSGIGLGVGSNFASGLVNSNMVGTANNQSDKARNALKRAGNGSYGWGLDAGKQWARGLNESQGFVRSAAAGVAALVRARLHFSVPDTGPLSDADTYMPDFIDLLVKGINQNKYKLLGAVSGLAQDMKTDLGLNPDVTNTLTNNTVFQPVNNFAITIGNKEIKDYAVEAVTSSISSKMRAQNMNRGLL